MFLFGKNSVFERIKANPKSIKKIYLLDNYNVPEIQALIKYENIPAIRKSEKELLRIKRSDDLQGIIAEVNNFSYASLNDLLENYQEKGNLIFLDSVTDPQNLGSIIRTLACLDGFGLVIPRHDCCEVNETVLHVACGGENYVPISLVTNLSTALIEAKKKGFWIAGAVVEPGQDISQFKLSFPLCLVLGSEGKGIRRGIRNNLELKLSLPMSGARLSFNVAISCAIFCYEINRQRKI